MSPRRLYWTAAVLAVAAIVGGGLVAWRGYRSSPSVTSVVRSYFAALERGDSAAALGYGDVPDGPHTMLTPAVLAAQRATAPIRSVKVIAAHTRSNMGNVEVDYQLNFPGAPQQVHDTVPLVRRNGRWRLQYTAISTGLVMATAINRASVTGKVVPDGSVLMFPGALPISFDSPYLQLDPVQDYVSFGTGSVVSVAVTVSKAGRDAVIGALTTALRTCLTAPTVDPRCPLPDDRFVPGTIRAPVPTDVGKDVTISLSGGPSGLLGISGTVSVNATYKKLTYANVAISAKGVIELNVSASAYAVAPLRLTWSPT